MSSFVSLINCADGSTIFLSIFTSARSTVEPSDLIISAADRVAPGGLGGEEPAELIAILVEDRLGARQVVGHGQDIAADRLGVLADISIGHDQRLLDHGAGAGREEAVEAAVERGRGYDGDQHRRHRGDDRKQADDLDVKARAGAAAAARLDHLQTSRPMMASRSSPVTALPSNSLTTTSCTGEIGVRPESTRNVAVADSNATPTATAPISREAIGIGAAAAGSSGADLINSRHNLRPRTQLLAADRDWKRQIEPHHPPRVMLLYNNVAQLRQLLGVREGCPVV